MRLAVMCLSSLIATSACRTTDAGSDAKLVGGTPAAAGQFPSTLIWTASGSSLEGEYCTGTKVADRFILTATHCVLKQRPLPGQEYTGPWVQVPALAPGKKLKVSSSLVLDAAAERERLTIVRIHWHSKVAECLALGSDAPFECHYRVPLVDVALIEVAPQPTSAFARMSSASISFDVIAAGDAITMTGYGSQGEDDDEPATLKFYKTKVAAPSELANALVGTEAERDGSPDWNLYFGALGPLARAGRANLGSGDSGGAVIRTGDRKVVGVNSDGFCNLVTSGCQTTTNSIFARLDDAEPLRVGTWVRDVLGD